jgi:hypothetical protein
MRSISRAAAICVVAVAATVFSAGAINANGDSGSQGQASAARAASLYLSRTSFDGDRKGVVEALARINSSQVPIQIDLLISLHGLEPNVTYNVVGSKKACSQRHNAADAVFDETLAADPGIDRFLKSTVDGSGSPKNIKSARIFNNGVRVGCKATKLYTAARYP